MKKSFIFGAALMLMGALSFQSCTKADNPSVPREPAVAVIDNGMDLADAIAKFAKDGVLSLPEGIELTMNKEIELTEPLMIVGDEKAPAVIVTKGGFIPSKELVLENLIIDASEVSTPFIALSKEPIAEFTKKADGTNTDYYGIQNITLKNVIISGVKHSIIYDNNKKYCVADLTIDNCVIGLQTESVNNQAFVSFQGGGVKDFTVKNSTIFQTGQAESNYFLRYNNSARLDRYGFDTSSNTQSINYINNTFYNVGKTGQWGNYNGIAGQKYSEFHVVGNIWVDCGNGQISRRLLGGRNASSYTTCEFDNNTYWFNGAAETGNTDYDKGTQLASDPAFKDAANGNFTPTGADQIAKKTGDPRWFAVAE